MLKQWRQEPCWLPVPEGEQRAAVAGANMALPTLDFTPQTLVPGRKLFCTPFAACQDTKSPFSSLKDT